jgi:hypothetical protein
MTLPRLATWLLVLAAPPDERADLLADLQEEALALARSQNPRIARAWYRRQALRSIVPLLKQRAAGLLDSDAHKERQMSTFLHDLLNAARQTPRARGYATLVTLTLAVGLGAVLSVLGLTDATLRRDPGFPNVDRVVVLWETFLPKFSWFYISPGALAEWQRQSKSLEAIAGYSTGEETVTGNGSAESIKVTDVTPNFFDLLGTRPIAGRVLHRDDSSGLIVSEALARQRFGTVDAAVGRTLMLNSVNHPILGVLPSSFRFPADDVMPSVRSALSPSGRSPTAGAVGRPSV